MNPSYKKQYMLWILSFLVLIVIMIAASSMESYEVENNIGVFSGLIGFSFLVALIIWAYLILFQKNKKKARGYIHLYGFIGYVLLIASVYTITAKSV